jgi:xylulokinase
MMAAIGTGAVKEGVISMSMGTSGTLFGYSGKPVIDKDAVLAAFCSSTGGWLPLLCTMNCTVASEKFRALFGLGVKDFDGCASKAAVGSDGVVVLPFFNGERTPNLPHGRASLNGVTASNFSRENICRAALESAVFGMRMGLEALAAQGFTAKEIRLTGGGSKSPIWRDIAANVMKLPIVVPASNEAAALGGAVQALWTLQGGDIGKLCDEHIQVDESAKVLPDAGKVKAYDAAYGEYQKYLEKLAPLYK